jgi:LDH2 family malate/lactate/ureidoglycolate dehydrogenase
MVFACPRTGLPPLVWDQASSMIAQGEVLLAATRGHRLPHGIGLDAEGVPTLDPNAVLQGGSMMPFGGHKGSAIAFMIEVLAAGLTGGRFGFEDNSAAYPGAQTSNAGEVVILIDPLRIGESHFFERIELLLEENRGERRRAAPFRAALRTPRALAARGDRRLRSELDEAPRSAWRKLKGQRVHHRNRDRAAIARVRDPIVIDWGAASALRSLQSRRQRAGR